MKKNILLLCFIFNFGILSYAQDNFQNQSQDNTRIATLENKLQVLSVEVPGLAEKVSVNISNTTLLNFLRAVSQVHKININLSDQLNTINIINGFNDVTVQDLLVFLVKEYQLDIQFTGNILSIKKYIPPTETPVEKELVINYDLAASVLSMDLRNDPLPKVFRKITELSGKNLLYTPELNTKNLSLYLSNVPIEVALQKLAETNDLDFNKTRDDFYEFESIPGLNDGSNNSGSRRRNRKNANYKIVDTLNSVLSVDLRNASVAELINNVSEDLELNIFTASPLENAGKVTVKAEAISFDDLLIKIFESNANAVVQNPAPSNQNTRNNTSNQQGGFQNNASSSASTNFTFKKEGNVYYFGTENQLTIKKIEMVQMMHRSIAMLGDANPSGGAGGSSFGNNNFVTGGTSFFGNQGNSNLNQNRANNRNQGGLNSGVSRNSSSNSSNRSNSAQAGSISDIFPASVTEGLEIKIDTELNSFVVSGSGARVEKFKNFIKYIDKPVPLILIEVMILEVSRSATVETGVEFGIGKEPTTTEGATFPNANITLGAQTINRIIGGFDGFGSLNLGNVVPNFYMDIKAMESNGNVKILSTPKLSTLNGHKAYLSSGQTTYYAVTSQNIFGSQNPQTSEIVNYQPIDAELALEFKPFVSGDGQITLDIQVIQSNFSGERIAEDAPPDINSRRFSSIMRMRANDVAILGGIEEKVKNDSGSGVPLLSRIPIIKWLFSKRRREDSKKKLNVIIKPTVFY
ncbi:type II secretion system protein GspD [uncultured Aquimarina sp.]|uniref:type II secretion system protein GspD n=1 Tax=uncultured Aquimarina sp. TaxID=575652 RepID=UPI002622A4C9|nr:type II and III secretion system protein [uncultured Aquimarina sp.]